MIRESTSSRRKAHVTTGNQACAAAPGQDRGFLLLEGRLAQLPQKQAGHGRSRHHRLLRTDCRAGAVHRSLRLQGARAGQPAAQAGRRALVRHRRPGPRHLFPDHLRNPDFPLDRHQLRCRLHRRRHDARHRGRLLRPLARCAHLPLLRHSACVPRHSAGDRHRGRSRAFAAECAARHRHRERACVRPARPSQGAQPSRGGIHHGRPGDRHEKFPHSVAAYSSQLPGPDHRARHARHRDGDHRGGSARISRHGRAAPGAGMGQDAVRFPAVHPERAVDGHFPGLVDHADGARLQSDRGRPARCAGSEDEKLIEDRLKHRPEAGAFFCR
ncbi:hypothetical protein BN871_BF_00310 [Paenibacillus sp. P22]|nr:hypothetical protein BN871_BF_00310 [Paenibacillus sp. P22]